MSKQKPVENVPAVVFSAPVAQTMLASYETLPLTADRQPVCTWPLTDVAGRAKLHQLIAGNTLVLWDLCEQKPIEIIVSDIAASFGSYEPEDRPGELVEGPVFYLCGPQGDYHTGGGSIFRSLQQLSLIEGAPPWHPPIILRAERCPTRSRKTRLALTFIGRSE